MLVFEGLTFLRAQLPSLPIFVFHGMGQFCEAMVLLTSPSPQLTLQQGHQPVQAVPGESGNFSGNLAALRLWQVLCWVFLEQAEDMQGVGQNSQLLALGE